MIAAAQPDPILELIARTIVEHFHPRRIVLFGSRARGDARADSDYDVLVELETDRDPRQCKAAIQRLFPARSWSMDIVVQQPGVHEGQRDDPGWMNYDIAREGVVLYAADGVSRTVRRPARAVREGKGRRRSFTSVSAWFEKARRDLAVADLIAQNGAFWDSVCFNAQQAGEKALKALVIQSGRRPARTHNLVTLLATCREAGWAALDIDDDCERLSPYAVDPRYPEEAPIPSESDGRLAVNAARRIVLAVGECLAGRAVP